MKSITVNVYDLISWAVALVSIIAFLYERKKNDKMKHYMSIQGLLNAIYEKSLFYRWLRIESNETSFNVTKENYKLLLDTIYSDQRAMLQMLGGIMKSLELKRDIPFNIQDFLDKAQPLPQIIAETKPEKLKQEEIKKITTPSG
jgi:hypothetical protein